MGPMVASLDVPVTTSIGPRRGRSMCAAITAASAWFGAVGLVVGWIGFPDRIVRRLPFDSPALAGVALAAVVAAPSTVLAVEAQRGGRRTDLATLTVGALLVGWIVVQVIVIRTFSWFQPTFLLIGAAFAWVGRGAVLRRRHRP